MNLVKKVPGDLTYLSPLEPEAAGLWYAWHNDLEIGLLAGSPGHRSPGCLQEFQKTIARFADQRFHAFLIVTQAEDRPIGWCALARHDTINRRAELAVMIGERDSWGRGYGEDALAALFDYGFNLLNLNSVELVVNEENGRALRCYKKLGFTVTGRKRQARILGAKRLDLITMDLLADEFAHASRIQTLSEGVSASGTR